MEKLKLNFLDNPQQLVQQSLISIMENFGKQICDYGKEYFTSLVPYTSRDGVLIDFSLYIIAPEIKYDYKVVNVELVGSTKLKVVFFTLITNQTEYYDIDITNGTAEYERTLIEIFSTKLFNESLRFLVNQILQKRDYREEIRDKIIPGEARVVRLVTGEQMSVGFQRIEGDEVIYYTGKGLREIFKPNMTEEERKKSDQLKQLSEEELIRQQYMARKKINEFTDIK
ncbi:MAG: hypothetical protein JW870_04080 [Candidatus Delongbacteria bacterium]|nr:hypothetical protein [Candidatus Delongbacteria bacterium]